MNRRDFLVRTSAAVGAAALARSAVSAPQITTKPNVIWLIADQMRGQAIACNGDPNVRTPNIDRLSATGINFQRARSGFPLCSPFRGTMLTSRYPHHMVPGHEYPLPTDHPTIANIFNDAGYHTAYFGKWHLDGYHESQGRSAFHVVPPNRRGGFKTWIGYDNNNSPWDCWVHGGGGKDDATPRKLPGYETDSLTDLLIQHVKDPARKETPFFAVLSVQPPHNPYIAPAEYMSHYNGERLKLRPNVPPIAAVQERARRELAGYYAQIENWDTNIGRVINALSDAGLLTNTHIMVFSDHGDQHGSHGQFLKTNPYEESTRIPMILSGEQSFYDRGTMRSDSCFAAVDIAPTTLGLCGIAAPSWMEGYDYSWKRYNRKPAKAEPDSAYLQLVIPTGHGDSINTPYRGVVTRDGWKYACFANQSWMLFNLNEDPYELANLAQNAKYKAERRKLIARLKQWVADTDDKFAIPAD